MSLLPNASSGDFEAPDPGNYRGVFLGIEPFEGGTGEFGPSVLFSFEVCDLISGEPTLGESGNQIIGDGVASAKMTPNAKARKWLTALVNREVEDGEDSDTLVAEAIGKTAMLTYVLKGEKVRLAEVNSFNA